MLIPKFLNKRSVLRIHDRQIEKFGGSFGIRDPGLLESALAQPQATFGGEFLHSTIYDQAAAYLFTQSDDSTAGILLVSLNSKLVNKASSGLSNDSLESGTEVSQRSQRHRSLYSGNERN